MWSEPHNEHPPTPTKSNQYSYSLLSQGSQASLDVPSFLSWKFLLLRQRPKNSHNLPPKKTEAPIAVQEKKKTHRNNLPRTKKLRCTPKGQQNSRKQRSPQIEEKALLLLEPPPPPLLLHQVSAMYCPSFFFCSQN